MRAATVVLALVAGAMSAGVYKRTDDTYTECYPDRGLEQQDALDAADYLGNVLAFAKGLPLAKDECIYKRHNTTITSLCNGNARDRTVTQDEVKRGMNQLFKTCDQLGAFTGVHVINNLTFAAYGIFGGVNIRVPDGANPPDTPGSKKPRTWLEFVGDGPRSKRQDPDDGEEVGDCLLGFNGDERDDCSMGEDVYWEEDEDGVCGPIQADNECQVFCEQTRTGLLGPETKAPGEFGESQLPGSHLAMTEGEETSVTQGFSVSLEGIVEEIFGAGVGYEWSKGSAKVKTIERSFAEVSSEYRTRWVFFPKLIESCGVITRRSYNPGTDVVPPIAPFCQGDPESTDGQCSISPHRNSDGDASVFWALRYENDDATLVDIEDQHPSYKDICDEGPDPDGDGENECKDTPNEPDDK